MQAMHQFQVDSTRFSQPERDSAQNPAVQKFVGLIAGQNGFSNQVQFNAFAQDVLRAWHACFPVARSTTSLWDAVIADIDTGRAAGAGIAPIRTGWGGVSILVHEHPYVEKYLAVRRDGYLAFEKHELKEEALEVLEGSGVLIYREPGQSQLRMLLLEPGVKVEFKPGQEHCVIATENLLILEKGRDFKGMDKDLIFIFEPA